jgi:acetyl esterase/lipase
VEADNNDKADIGRRGLLSLGALAALAPTVACAQTVATPPAARAAAARPVPALREPLPSFSIWPGKAPGGENVTATESVVLRGNGQDPNDTAFTHITNPILMVTRPAKPNGAALLMCPGGGYVRIAASRAGSGLERWFADQGITVFQLLYRLPGDGWAAGPNVSLQDAQRSIRLIRSRASEYGLDPARVGVMGFSAGGHVAARAATMFGTETYAPVDEADKLSSKPMAAGLFFPVITATLPYGHVGSLNELIGRNPTDAVREELSAEKHVPADAPPMMIACSGNDPVVPTENSLMMYQALRARKIPSELHIYELGGHGLPNSQWQPLFMEFLKRHGVVV